MKSVVRMTAALGFVLLLGGASAAPAAEKHSTLALSFREGQGSEVSLVGVEPRAGRLGQADVKRSQGRTRIKLHLEKALPHPQSLSSLYTSYVLWAVAPEGRAESLAQLPHGKAFRVEATTAYPSFGLIVTAEPHPAVVRPGWRLVAETALTDDTRGRVQAGTIEFERAPERQAAGLGRPDFETPLLVLGARRALEMAEAAGAADFAGAELRDAEVKLGTLEHAWSGRSRLSREAESMARDVMRLAEHARTLTADRAAQAARFAERRAAQSAVTQAQTEAERSARRAEQERLQAAQARQDAERAEQEALRAKESTRLAQTEAERARVGEEVAKTEAERARVGEEAARTEADRARLDAQQARQDNAEIQEQLFRSLSAILETRKEARGLIVSLSDVLFDFDRASLKPGAREKLSKLSGILLAYPGHYSIEIEGHTDSIGSDDYNQQLSEGRAESVSAYIRQAGIPAGRVTRVTGFGETRPVAGNDSDAGRQMNRRVELVITDLQP